MPQQERTMPGQHIQDNGQHIHDLDRRLRELSAAFTDLGNSDDFDELFKIIHFPGWTTWPEVFLVNTVIDAMERAVADSRSLRKALLQGALAISEASAR
jgi:hypothetical protein